MKNQKQHTCKYCKTKFYDWIREITCSRCMGDGSDPDQINFRECRTCKGYETEEVNEDDYCSDDCLQCAKEEYFKESTPNPMNKTREEILESIIKEQVHLAFSKFGKMAMPSRTESDGIERKAIIKSALIFADQEKRKAFNEALELAAENAEAKCVENRKYYIRASTGERHYRDEISHEVDKQSILKLKQ